MNEYKSLVHEDWVNIDLHEEDIFKWDIAVIVLNPESLYYGGYLRASMAFPKNYPYAPPGMSDISPYIWDTDIFCMTNECVTPPAKNVEFRFLRPLYHPNIYPDGKLCISILHAPGDDEMSGEHASERWSPAQRVESVLISILSLLDDAEVNSPANVDAGKQLRHEPEVYRSIVRGHVEDSKKDIPEGFVMPTHESTMKKQKPVDSKVDDVDFWADSDIDDDVFGGSDSEGEFDMDQDTGSDED